MKKTDKKSVLVPLADKVIIKELKEETRSVTKSGIILPENTEKGDLKKGTIIAVGSGRYENGKHIPPSVTVNDIVYYGWGEKITLHGEEYTVLRESEIVAVLK